MVAFTNGILGRKSGIEARIEPLAQNTCKRVNRTHMRCHKSLELMSYDEFENSIA